MIAACGCMAVPSGSTLRVGLGPWPTWGLRTGMGNRLLVRIAFALSWSVHTINHPGQLSQAILPWVGETSTGAVHNHCWRKTAGSA